ncbi:nicotinamide riboside transporter PnuC [Massilia eburnea]|nr:nicotinamide riboside transporter PnuC [Massilia eburnea]
MAEPLEIAANAIMAVSIFLAGRNNIHSWWTGIAGCSLFAVLFYGSQLYADVALQLLFIATCIIGWRQWLRGDHGHSLHIRTTRPATLLKMALAGVFATAGYGLMLKHYTNAYAPFIDSAVLMFSVIAQVLLMGRRIENWPVWLLVNTVSVPLYASRGLYLTAALYAAYWINAIVAWRHWRRQREAGA